MIAAVSSAACWQRDAIGSQLGINPRRVQRFIDINISQPRDQRLIEQRGFDEAIGLFQFRKELIGANFQRLRPKTATWIGFAKPENSTESARITKMHFKRFAIHQIEHQMRMLQQRRLRRFDREPAGHAKMDVKAIAIIERDDNPFSARRAMAAMARAREMCHQICVAGRNNVIAMQHDAADSCANHPSCERVNDGLYFR